MPLGPVGSRLVAVGAIGVLAVVHVAGVGLGMRLITAVTLLKIGLIVALTAGALASADGSWSHFVPFVARRPGAPALAGAAAGAFVSAFFSFGGWWEVTRIAGEVRDPARTLPRALVLGLLTVMIVYAAATMSFIYAIPMAQVADGQGFVAQVGDAIVGRAGGAAVALIVMVCVLGSLATMQMLAPRLYFAMAQDGLFPAAAAAVHPRFGTPARAIIMQAVLASVLVALGTFDTIVAYFVFITVLFISAVVASVFVVRRRDPGFHVPGYPWTPLTFLLMVAALLVLLVVNNPLQALLGLALVAAAVPVYRLGWRSRGPLAEEIVS
jgi:APA family basic amino acid/polyamine antiporter